MTLEGATQNSTLRSFKAGCDEASHRCKGKVDQDKALVLPIGAISGSSRDISKNRANMVTKRQFDLRQMVSLHYAHRP